MPLKQSYFPLYPVISCICVYNLQYQQTHLANGHQNFCTCQRKYEKYAFIFIPWEFYVIANLKNKTHQKYRNLPQCEMSWSMFQITSLLCSQDIFIHLLSFPDALCKLNTIFGVLLFWLLGGFLKYMLLREALWWGIHWGPSCIWCSRHMCICRKLYPVFQVVYLCIVTPIKNVAI
jgi:hypothetical protein